MSNLLREIEKLEILTLLDNFVDMVAQDNTGMVQRAMPLDNGYFRKSVAAEHGYSAVISVYDDQTPRKLLLDFGFSERGAVANAEILGVDFSEIECVALSHGHPDHLGGFEEVAQAARQCAHRGSSHRLRHSQISEKPHRGPGPTSRRLPRNR